MTIQLVYRSIRHPLGILEDTPVQVSKFAILCNFVVMDMDKSFQVPIIIGKSFLTTAEEVIDVSVGRISF